jgi:hypothetical protein
MRTVRTSFACSNDRQLADATQMSCHEMVLWGLTKWQTGDMVMSDEV